jgi:MYXO-CTERM domain-containing protein
MAVADLESERDSAGGAERHSCAIGGQSSCHCQASPAPSSLFAVTLAAVALIIGRRRR